MRRGTTPKNTFTVDTDLREATEIYLTYKQGCRELEKTKSDMEITEDTVIVNLTQGETLGFNDDEKIKIQFRAKFEDGNVIASNVMITSVAEILKEGEI